MLAEEMVLPRWQRWVLPAALGSETVARGPEGGVTLPRSARDWAVDVVMFAVVCMAMVSGSFTDHRMDSPALFVGSVVLGVAACLSLWLRRRNPLGVALVSAFALVFSTAAVGAAFMTLFTVAIHCRPRRAVQIVGVLAVAVFLHTWLTFIHAGLASSTLFESLATALGTVLVGAVVVTVGSLVRVRRELVFSLREQANRLQREQELLIRDAKLAERSRIAREMHDALSHRISLLSVYAGALEFNANASPEQVTQAAGVIRVNARAAQEELREVIGVLRFGTEADERAGDHGADVEAVTAAVQPPQPTLADLEQLVEDSRAAGMRPTFTNTIADGALAPMLQRTIYRVVQEGLTNARKHAPGQLASVRIGVLGEADAAATGAGTDGVGAGTGRSGWIEVAVVNRPAVGALDVQPPIPEQIGSGTGLIGLAERVKLSGGQLQARSLADDGFELVAKLPMTPPAPLEDGEPATAQGVPGSR
jgi:signal transduction histidine kinase